MVFDRILLAIQFWWKNLLPLFLVCLPFALIGTGIQLLLGDVFIFEDEKLVGANFATVAAMMVLQVLAEGALICQLDALSKGRPRPLLDCLLFSVYLMPKLALCMLLMVMPLVGAVLLASVLASGPAASLMMMFILPGVWGYLRLSLAVFYTALDRQSPVQALSSSLIQTQTQQWPLLISWMLLLILVLMLAATLSSVLIAVLGSHGGVLLVSDLMQKMLGVTATVLLFQAWRTPAAPTVH